MLLSWGLLKFDWNQLVFVEIQEIANSFVEVLVFLVHYGLLRCKNHDMRS